MDILNLANDKESGKIHFIEEIVSGKFSWRNRKIATGFDELKQGNSLIVSELAPLEANYVVVYRNPLYFNQKGASIYTIKGNWQFRPTCC